MQLRRPAGWPCSGQLGPRTGSMHRSAISRSTLAQQVQPTRDIYRAVATAVRHTIRAAEQSPRADTALCFASDSVSDPAPNPAGSEAAPLPEATQQAQQQGSVASASGFSPRDLRTLWDSVARPLLRVGRAGVQESHGQSLVDLLSQHALVKVQLNAATVDAESVGSQLGAVAGARLLQCKGRTILMASSRDSLATLMAAAAQVTQRSAAAKQRKLESRELARAGPPEFKAGVSARLNVLEGSGVITATDFDAMSLRALAALPEAQALKVLEQCSKTRMRSVRNRSAWLTSQCRRLDKPAAAAGMAQR